ncbi:hypothetical protein [Neisseria sp. S1]|uniref:hypothetical protein n=1 Tax=Neisseria sp. S1 TaxID=3318354 RepID=UPI003A837ED2
MKYIPVFCGLAVSVLAGCAATPEQIAAREEARRRYEQDLQITLAAQCDVKTAEIMRAQFDKSVDLDSKASKEFRLQYIDKISDPMFQSCYKMAWQNYISQKKLQQIRYYYDDWADFYYPFQRPFRRYYGW